VKVGGGREEGEGGRRKINKKKKCNVGVIMNIGYYVELHGIGLNVNVELNVNLMEMQEKEKK